MDASESLDFAYKYPFSQEAKAVVDKLGISRLEPRYLALGAERVQAALDEEVKKHIGASFFSISIDGIKQGDILSYVASRMIVSAISDRTVIESFVNSEARRSEEALRSDTSQNAMRLSTELGIRVQNSDGEFMMKFSDFLQNAPRVEEHSLVNQKLSMGYVIVSYEAMIALISEAMRRAIRAGLPIPKKELPPYALDFAKSVRLTVKAKPLAPGTKGINWIERLLATPIPDVRHRTVNLILAPYMINIKGMDVESATKVIMEYIERCKAVNPDTRITEKYVRYQCEYAKRKGMKPLKLVNARDLLGSIVELGAYGPEAGKGRPESKASR
ncbi:DNA primase noncatalytic subunit PriX [Candidatus Marsarchaeota archaeon]|jgi:hypothetical protein|nr:DNA primase noncatalytic subunit PriX [Candidatus Marsarchaeota archaeon]MCL5100026.1 DNA primase noncatalytic subunit PriX [Candidatus Marsarchaeota archaeon]